MKLRQLLPVMLCLCASAVSTQSSRALDSTPGRLSAGEWITSSKSPRVLAHRGCWEFAPENSLAAMKACSQIGVHFVEGDIQTTRDGVLVIMHDGTLDRTTNLSGELKDHTYKELQAGKLREGFGGKDAPLTNESIPSFAEWLRQAKASGVFLLLDVKEDIYNQVYNVVAEQKAEQNVVFLTSVTPDDPRFRVAPFLGKVAFITTIAQCGPHPIKTQCFTQAEVAAGKFITANERFHPIGYAFAGDDAFVAQGYRVVQQTGHRAIDGMDKEESPEGRQAYWGRLVDEKAAVVITNYASGLSAYLGSRGSR